MPIAIILEDFAKSKDIISSTKIYNEILYEIRYDLDPQLINLMKNPDIPKDRSIITLRSKQEGGKFPKQQERQKLLKKFIKLRPAYIDIEIEHDLSMLDTNIEHPDINFILSKHDYSDKMKQAAIRYKKRIDNLNISKDGVVIKFVGNPFDSLDAIEGIEVLSSSFSRYIILGIGLNGVITRTLSAQFNQEFVFGATTKGEIPHYSKLLPLLTSNPIFLGLIGRSLSHSLSPLIHESFLSSINRSGFYHLFEIDNIERFERFIDKIQKYQVVGVNVTFPFKQRAFQLADIREPICAKSGVANTLHFVNGQIHAYNTDISGFKRFILNHELERYNSALIFGAGGAGKAVAIALLELGFRIMIVNRSQSRLDDLPEYIKSNASLVKLSNYIQRDDVDLYINATTLGYEEINPTSRLKIPGTTKVVIDLNYSWNQTVLVKEGEESGLQTFDGKEMLFNQAVDAFEIWTNSKINRVSLFGKFRRSMKH